MIRNASEAAVVNLAMATGGVVVDTAARALELVAHPSTDLGQAAAKMLGSLHTRGVLDFTGSWYVPSADLFNFLDKAGLELSRMDIGEMIEEFGEYHGQHVSPAAPLKIDLQSYRAARNAVTRAKRQLWQCPSPWDYAERIKAELKGE